MVIPAECIPEHKPLRWKYSHAEGRNSLGLRNREVGQKKDQFRILFLGDSLVFDSETTSGLLYTQVVEERLNKENKGKREIEIINAGIPGYTTYQELEFLKVHGLDMNPDLVILGFVFNDLYYKYLHRPTKKKVPFLDLTEALYKAGGPRLFKDFLHLSPEGNDIVAREITGFLLKTRPYCYNHSGGSEDEMKQSLNPNIRADG